jgi:hypothetical protein
MERNFEKWQAFGYNLKTIIKAYEATSFSDDALAGAVMQSIQEGRGVPRDMQWVWTKEDDDDLQAIRDADSAKQSTGTMSAKLRGRANRAKLSLAAKHGEDGLRRRIAYKNDYERTLV